LTTFGSTKIRVMHAADAPAVLRIYQEGIDTGHATFQAHAPSWEEWDRAHTPDARLVAERDGAIAGWVGLSKISSREVYAGVAEHSVYIANDARGFGVGRLLLRAMVESSEAAGYWMLQSGVFPENKASIAAHESAGFRAVGIRKRVGLMSYGPMKGVWRDVVMVERRSQVVGVE
jgi:L-amino acid N-acyltransferase YncA